MPILFHPKPGTVLRCDYTGFEAPEMIKDRPVVIVSPRSRSHRLVTVVPLSTTEPDPLLEWHCTLTLDKPLSPKWPETVVWAKCDMLNTFLIDRLDRFNIIVGNARKYYDRRLSDEQLEEVRRCISKFIVF